MQLTINVKGELVRKGLADLGAEIPKVSRQSMRALLERVKRQMQEYPAEPAGQSVTQPHSVLGKTYRKAKGRYQRTGLLGARWAIEPNSNQGYVLSNTAARKGQAYGHYVVGRGDGTGQAWMHQGRWQKLRDIVDAEVAKLPPAIEDQIRMVARREGL
jgi:hypothetical protein